MASSGMRGQHAWSDMVSGITPSTGSGRTLFSVEEAMIVNMDLPLRAGDEESPESQRDLHVKTETIYFFICFLLMLFGKKKRRVSCVTIHWICAFPCRVSLHVS